MVMTRLQQQARDLRSFTNRWKRHRKDDVRIHNFTWRAKAYCFEKGLKCDNELTLFPDQSGGYKQCRNCGHVYGVGEY